MGKFVDLTGSVFGNLKVLYLAESFRGVFWNCCCDCGRKTVVNQRHLLNNNKIECEVCEKKRYENYIKNRTSIKTKPYNLKKNMIGFVDLTGKMFGKWKVLGRDNSKKKNGIYWICECQCENKVIRSVLGQSLKCGDSTSCGCFRREKNMLEMGEASFNRLIESYKKNAQKRNLPFTLTRQDIENLTKQNCHYCNRPPEQYIKKKRANGAYIYNGIDRVDNKIGYIIGNCVTCCEDCNRAKREMGEQEFYAWIDRVHAHIHRNDQPIDVIQEFMNAQSVSVSS